MTTIRCDCGGGKGGGKEPKWNPAVPGSPGGAGAGALAPDERRAQAEQAAQDSIKHTHQLIRV